MKNLLDSFIVNGIEYTYVDTIEFQNIKVNCYLGDEDYIFTFYRDEQELIIENPEIINLIKEQEGINPPQIYYYNPTLLVFANEVADMDQETINEVTEAFIEKIKEAKLPINEEYVRNRLSKVNYVYGVPKGVKATAFYHPATNSVVVPKGTIKEMQSCFTHEMIHACGGGIFNFFNLSMTGLIEGATEITNLRLNNEIHKKGSVMEKMKFDCNVPDSYFYPVVLIRQMEYILNESVAPSLIAGRKDFFDKFKDTYGASLYRFIHHRSNTLCKQETTGKDLTDYFMQTQNKILEVVFNKELQYVTNLENANFYIKRLKGFEHMMGIETRRKELNIFEQFYNEKLISVANRLKQMNIPEEVITNFLIENQYQKPEFKHFKTPEEELSSLVNNFEFYADSIIQNQLTIDPNKLAMYAGKGSDDNSYAILTYDGEIVVYVKFHFTAGRIFFDKNLTPELLSEITEVENGFEINDMNEFISTPEITNEKIKAKVVEWINKRILMKTKGDDSLLIQEQTYTR